MYIFGAPIELEGTKLRKWIFPHCKCECSMASVWGALPQRRRVSRSGRPQPGSSPRSIVLGPHRVSLVVLEGRRELEGGEEQAVRDGAATDFTERTFQEYQQLEFWSLPRVNIRTPLSSRFTLLLLLLLDPEVLLVPRAPLAC